MLLYKYRFGCVVLLVVLLLCNACSSTDTGYPGGLAALPTSPKTTQPPPAEETVTDIQADSVNFVREQADFILRERITPDMDTQTKIATVYRYIIEQTTFSDPVGLDVWRWRSEQANLPTYVENRAISPLVFGIGSCEDYAAALVILLEQMGFPAQYVAGYTLSVEGEYVDHAWTLVQINEKWYHLDSQLEQNIVRNHTLRYRYFLKTDEEMIVDHKWGENLIAYWPNLSDRDAGYIRRHFTYPACDTAWPARTPEDILLPPKPDLASITEEIEQERSKAALSPLVLNVQPPVLIHPEDRPAFQYGRTFLSQAEQQLYDDLYISALDFNLFSELPVPHGLSEKQLEQIVQYFWNDHPQFYWVQPYMQTQNNIRTIRLRVIDGLNFSQVLERDSQIQAVTEEILAQISGDAFSISTALHDYLAQNVVYDSSASKRDIRNLYGALLNKEAVCDGYTMAYQYLLQRAGIDCIFVQGKSFRGIPHSWNAVKLEDELWYYTDVTWDAPSENQSYVSHSYLHVPLTQFEKEHYWDSTQYPSLPTDNATESGYFPRLGRYVEPDAGQDINQQLANAFINELAAMSLSSNPVTENLEISIACSEKEFATIQDAFVRDLFPILQKMQAIAIQRGLPIQIKTEGKIACNFNETMQTLVLYPTVNAI